jgi:hypothetical protein
VQIELGHGKTCPQKANRTSACSVTLTDHFGAQVFVLPSFHGR